MMEIEESGGKLSEGAVAEALKTLDWSVFQSHLDGIALDEEDGLALVRLLRRNNDIVLKRADSKRAKKRAAFLQSLGAYLEDRIGPNAVKPLQNMLAVVDQIEEGYAEMLRALDSTVAAKLLPEIQAAAALQRAAYTYHQLQIDVGAEMRRRKEISLQNFRLTVPGGGTASPDGVLGGLIESAGMTLLLLGHRYKWFDVDKFLVLPAIERASDEDVFKAGLTELLSISWRKWERMEQRCRYFSGSLLIMTGEDMPSWSPERSETAIEYNHISMLEFYDHLANHRLNDRMVQTFQEMILKTNLEARAAGIAAPLSLPPVAIVSAREGHAGVMLSETLGYAIVDDQERPGGLRLIEWIRGYAVLQLLAEQHYPTEAERGLFPIVSRDELVSTLDRLGLKNGAAERFVDLASFGMSSRDMFDQPLVRMGDGKLLLFSPGVLLSDPGRVTLSAIGNLGEKLSRKGKSFERETLKFFEDEGFAAKAFKFKQGGKEFEYDAVFEWDDYVFIFECKNRTLSSGNPIAAYYFNLEMESARRQVLRLAKGLELHADTVLKCSGIDVKEKTIVPCVLNSLPYAMPLEDGVYMSDASSMKRFFQERYFHHNQPHLMKSKSAVIMHRTAMHSIWSGDKPTVADFLAYLANPLPLRIAEAHTHRESLGFGLGEQTVVAVHELLYREITLDSMAEVFGIDPEVVRHDKRKFKNALGKAVRRHDARSLIQAKRKWRSRRPHQTSE